jgi:hypothetical protein
MVIQWLLLSNASFARSEPSCIRSSLDLDRGTIIMTIGVALVHAGHGGGDPAAAIGAIIVLAVHRRQPLAASTIAALYKAVARCSLMTEADMVPGFTGHRSSCDH